jgi:alpha-beta hydrolase superfamily lysophospholipase
VGASKRLILAAAAALCLAGCATGLAPPGPAVTAPAVADDAFVMADGMRLPYRVWRPDGEPWAVVLALHGMNDSRDAWELTGPALAEAGVLVYAPDQRGFGETAVRGRWPGGAALVEDAREMTRLVRARHPGAKLYVMGESMGAAVAMCLAASADPGPADGWVLLAPAVWGRAEIGPLLRATLWLAYQTVPGMTLEGAPGVKIRASDNDDALRRLGRDPLTIHATRVDAIKGLVDLEDAAVAAAPHVRAPALFLYGGNDQLVPKPATEDAWRALPASGVREGYYPDGYHLLLRDLERAPRIADVLAWMRAPDAPLPSGSEAAARQWLASGGESPPSPAARSAPLELGRESP